MEIGMIIMCVCCALLGGVIGFLFGTSTYKEMRVRVTAEIIGRMRDAMKSLCYDDESVWLIVKRMGCKIMPPGVPPPHMSRGARLIAIERERQITEEGYDREHDSKEKVSDFILAAIGYCESAMSEVPLTVDKLRFRWPWDAKYFKPKGTLRDLVRAAALLAAAIDRMKYSEKED